MKSTFKVLFYLKKGSEKKNGEVMIMARITIDGKLCQFSTKQSIQPDNWSITAGKAKGRDAGRINALLDDIRSSLNTIYHEMQRRDNYVTAEKVKNEFLGHSESHETILSLFQKHNDDVKQLVGISKTIATYRKYEVTRRHLAEFIQSKYNVSDISIKEISPMFITDFELYLRTACKCGYNTTAKFMQFFKRIIIIARNNGILVGNNPDRQNIYSAALGLYNSRIVKLINKKGQLKSSVIIDELPTIYFRGLDNLIATARSNKVAVLLGFQDYSQLTRDYGDKESRVIQNTVGNVFSGQVVGETAKILSERFGKVLQKRQSMTINQREKSTSISTQMDSLIPASKISNLTQGMFVGAVADNFDERIEQKIFHCEIVVDNEKVKRETARYVKLPQIIDFTDKDGNDRMQEEIQANYDRIRQEVRQIVEDEITRIKNDPELCHLIKEEE